MDNKERTLHSSAYPVSSMSKDVASAARTHPPMAGHSIMLKCSCGGGLVMLSSCSATNRSDEQFSYSRTQRTGEAWSVNRYGFLI